MAAIFQLRRGSGSVSLQDGELYVNKGIESLQYQVDDKQITLAKLDEPNTGTLNLNGDITASNAYFSGDVAISGNLFLGNSQEDNISALGVFTTNLNAGTTNTYNIGSKTSVWANIYANSMSASAFTGSVYGMGDPTSFSTSVDSRLDYLEGPFSTSVDSRMDLLETAMSGSKRLYVSPEGKDTNDGKEPHTPFKTIKAAVESLGSAIASNIQRTTIFVGSGNYTENNPIAVPPGVAIVGDTLRTVRLTASNPTKDFFHCHDGNYFYGLRFLNLQNPSFSFSYPCSTANTTISGDGVSAITLIHTESGYVDGESVNVIIEGPDVDGGVAATATATVSGGVLSINLITNGSGYVAGEKPHVSIQAPTTKRPLITTSPYIQNCSSITGPFTTDGILLSLIPGNPNYAPLPYNINDVRNQSGNLIGSGIIDDQGAGGGIRIDGNLVSALSPLESFVADAFTQVNQGGPGHLVINNGYAQFVSCFTTFCTYGFKTANGGFANISNSVIDFGNKGLIAKTYFPQTYNSGSSLETKTSQVSGFVIDENGAGYTGSVASVTISGGGASVDATAEATVNANGSIDEIVLLTPGSGYVFQPNVTIATPTGPGAITATTVAGKALISGVSEMLMSLQSGSRGIDISSNMILNGVDYLVTDVATVLNQPNQRRITTYPAPPSITTNDQIRFHQLSNISTGGLVMEYGGSGVTYNALPKFGGVPIRTREINETAPGRVFYSTVDNIGNLKIGDFFAVNQLTGEVTIDANSFNLSGLNAIGPFRRNGVAVGVVLQEVSNNTTLLNSQGLYGEDTAPTQYAVKEYIDPISASLDSRLDNIQTFTASISGTNVFTSSTNVRLNNLESKSASVDISISNLHSYTSSLNNAIQLTGSTVSFLGNIVVYGTQSVINSENLAVADNLIYLNNESFVTNPDLGIVGNYNDGTYGHTGIYRDSSDGVWRVFKGYTPEPSGNIDLAHTSYRYADFYANEISASSLIGIGNVTSYSTSVNSRLVNLETKSGSVDTLIVNINEFTASVTASLEKIYQTTSSLNTATASLYTSASLMSASIVSLTSSVYALQFFSGNVNTRFDTLQTYTTSVNSRLSNLQSKSESVDISISNINLTTASLNTSVSNINLYTASVNTSITNINTFTESVDSKFTTLQTYTSSINNDLTSIHQTTASLNLFTASAYVSFSLMTASIEDQEERIAYLEGIGGISGGNPLTQLHIFSASAKISIVNLEAATGSYETKGRGIVSGSSQILDGSTIHSSSIGDYQFNSIGIGMAASETTGRIDASGDIVAYSTSDINFKENIVPITEALLKLENISGNTYDWKTEFEYIHGFKGNDVGVIAQEIQKVLPEAVRERENGYLAVQYEKIIPLLIESIKELSAKVDRLENK